ncbi:MAG: hypothetical protein M3P53_06485 [Actinomycetota bacterium]|nr:hypothetical protein [Actinomycetota bacterium]
MEARGDTPRVWTDPGDLAELVALPGPFLTVLIATESGVEQAGPRNESRWRARRSDVAAAGAPEEVLALVDPLVPDAHQEGGTLFAVATAEGVHHVSHWPALPGRELARWAPLPSLTPLLDLRQSRPPHVVVVADRSGADLAAFGPEQPELTRSVDGDLQHGRKVQPGGWSQRRYQERAENVWEHNAKEVAEAVVRLANQVDARLVALAGDVRAVTLLQEILPDHLAVPVQVLDGSRAVDGREGIDAEQLDAALAAVSAGEAAALLDKLAEERGQGDRAAVGAEPVAKALAMAQVEVLLVYDPADDRPDDERRAWFGDEASLVATSPDSLRQLGVDDPRSARLVDVFVRAALGTGAGVEVVPDESQLSDGVGALLRWT